MQGHPSTSCSKESCLGLSSYLTPSNPSNIVMNLFCTFSSSMPSFIQLGHENYSQQFKWGLTIDLQLDYAIPTVPSAFCNESKNGKHLLHSVYVLLFSWNYLPAFIALCSTTHSRVMPFTLIIPDFSSIRVTQRIPVTSIFNIIE